MRNDAMSIRDGRYFAESVERWQIPWLVDGYEPSPLSDPVEDIEFMQARARAYGGAMSARQVSDLRTEFGRPQSLYAFAKQLEGTEVGEDQLRSRAIRCVSRNTGRDVAAELAAREAPELVAAVDRELGLLRRFRSRYAQVSLDEIAKRLPELATESGATPRAHPPFLWPHLIGIAPSVRFTVAAVGALKALGVVSSRAIVVDTLLRHVATDRVERAEYLRVAVLLRIRAFEQSMAAAETGSSTTRRDARMDSQINALKLAEFIEDRVERDSDLAPKAPGESTKNAVDQVFRVIRNIDSDITPDELALLFANGDNNGNKLLVAARARLQVFRKTGDPKYGGDMFFKALAEMVLRDDEEYLKLTDGEKETVLATANHYRNRHVPVKR